ncbi:hypothetical protein [Thermoflexus hugenholtzii]
MIWTTPVLLLFLGVGAGLIRHVLAGGGARRLIGDLILGCLGMILGHAAGRLLAPGFGQLGTTAVLPGLLGALLLLGLTSLPSSHR